MENIGSTEIEMIEKQIEDLAKEINLDEKHVKRFFDGTYTSISLTRKSKLKMVVLLTQVAHDGSGKVNNPIIKATKEDNYDIISKMERFVCLVRMYRTLKKAEKMKKKIREDYAVSLVS